MSPHTRHEPVAPPRQVMIVAIARKLLVALWRFANTDLVPAVARIA